MKSTLLDIGLSEKEADTYLIIINHEEITASELSKLGKESRTHTYDTINNLIKKGIITYVVKSGVKFFKAANPERLLDFLKEKEAKIKVEGEKVAEIIPKLKEVQAKVSKDDTKIEVYEGKEGLKSLLNDIIREGKDFVTFGASTKVKEYLPEFVIKKYLNERKNNKIKSKQLFTDFYGVLESSLSENRKLPKEFAGPTTTLVYGEKVAIFLWTELPKIVLIINKDLAISYRNYFNLLWKITKT
ncbi:hypothetical protein HYS50_03930 [Candidatus Woesearchaeota archaeon]|nr:hypothetical protein [Candidatus Woesearchaeota archaeon]